MSFFSRVFGIAICIWSAYAMVPPISVLQYHKPNYVPKQHHIIIDDDQSPIQRTILSTPTLHQYNVQLPKMTTNPNTQYKVKQKVQKQKSTQPLLKPQNKALLVQKTKQLQQLLSKTRTPLPKITLRKTTRKSSTPLPKIKLKNPTRKTTTPLSKTTMRKPNRKFSTPLVKMSLKKPMIKSSRKSSTFSKKKVRKILRKKTVNKSMIKPKKLIHKKVKKTTLTLSKKQNKQMSKEARELLKAKERVRKAKESLLASKTMMVQIAKQKAEAAKQKVRTSIKAMWKAKQDIKKAKAEVIRSTKEIQKVKSENIHPDVLLQKARFLLRKAKQTSKKAKQMMKQAKQVEHQSTIHVQVLRNETFMVKKRLLQLKKQLYQTEQLYKKFVVQTRDQKAKLVKSNRIKINIDQLKDKYKKLHYSYQTSKKQLQYIKESITIAKRVIRHLQNEVVRTSQFVTQARTEWKRIKKQVPTHITNPTCVLCATIVDQLEDVVQHKQICKEPPKDICKREFDGDEPLFSSCTSIMSSHCPAIVKQMTYLHYHPFVACRSISLC